MIELKGKNGQAKVFTDNIDDGTIGQVINMLNAQITQGNIMRIMPDCHLGKGSTIGTTIKLNGDKSNWKVSPNVVGVDIGCGIMMYKLNDKDIDLKKLDEVINKYVPSGFSVHDDAKKVYTVNTKVLERLKIDLKDKEETRILKSNGTLGGGNHYIELAQDENGEYWLSVHSGSRYLGVLVAKHYQELAVKHSDYMETEMYQTYLDGVKKLYEPKEYQRKIEEYKDEFVVKDKALSHLNPNDLNDYLNDMEYAQLYARLNRQTMLDIIVERMNFCVADAFDSVHNYIDIENGIIRKGATSARDGERLVIPLNMRDGSLICVGKGNEDWNNSAPHGAGRAMSRTVAKEKIDMEVYKNQMKDVYTTSVVKSTLDEAPDAYKPAQEIIENIKDTADVIHKLKPVYNFKAK